MDYHDQYQRWRSDENLDPELKQELDEIASDEIKTRERFGRVLTFGTGGIRGEMGAGTARVNIYLVRKVTMGLARYLLANKGEKDTASVVIAHDTRRNSARFARETAAVLAFAGIQAWLFPQPEPTPLLSFAVRELKASAGVVITASHNPPADNGYKVYGPDGGQITDTLAQAIMKQVNQVQDELAVPTIDLAEAEAKGLLRWVEKEVADEYVNRVSGISFRHHWWTKGPLPVRVVYTPLHGTGANYVPRVLRQNGITDLFPGPEQMVPDASCPTVKCPNPEDWDVYRLAINLGQRESADLLMATDLDGDRLGVAVRNVSGGYTPLTGNQLGCLMLEYILSQHKRNRTAPPNGMVVQTVVTTGMGKAIASGYGVEVVETLTGFKYIGEMIKVRADNHLNTFLFGYEESYGYLVGDFVRDKDAMQAALLTAEIAAYYRVQGKTVLQALDSLYAQYGCFQERLINIDLKAGDMDQIGDIMERFRQSDWDHMAGSKVAYVYDYLTQTQTNPMTGKTAPIHLPSSNSMKIVMEDEAWFCIRPSGTEPKMKIYVGVRGRSLSDAEQRLEAIEAEIRNLLIVGPSKQG